jgi:hypothetical protein
MSQVCRATAVLFFVLWLSVAVMAGDMHSDCPKPPPPSHPLTIATEPLSSTDNGDGMSFNDIYFEAVTELLSSSFRVVSSIF